MNKIAIIYSFGTDTSELFMNLVDAYLHCKDSVEEYNKRSKRKMVGQDYINSLLKSALR